jgi:hypothetical protein
MAYDVPWAGLVAILLMFVLPALPAWLFEGPRTIKHRPTRHVCADCGARWVDGHTCTVEADLDRPPIRAELRRLDRNTALELRPVRDLRRRRRR